MAETRTLRDYLASLPGGDPADLLGVDLTKYPTPTSGPEGPPGADGKSAYAVALDNGFSGSEEEWLESLVGEQGPQGIQGPQGATGAKGDTGDTGPKGDQGEQGVQGVKGDTGDTGPEGEQGPQGEKGDKGDPGDQGPAGNDGLIQSIVAGTNITVDDSDPANPIISADGGSGTVQSVDIAVPTGFSVSGSPITTTGTITIAYASGYQGYTSAEASKLSGIASGATANSSDATLLNRANHTGTQLAATISDFSTAADARVSAAIGSTVQAYSAALGAIAGLSAADGNFIVGNGSTWVAESGATARASLGLGSLATLSSVNNANWSGTDLAIANGGTGQSSASAAFSALKQDATASVTGVVELATDAETQTGTDTTRAITPANLSARTATETRTGIVELATEAEMNAGTDTTRVPSVKVVADYVAANGGVPTTAGAVGTYVLAYCSGAALAFGDSVAGSTLIPTNTFEATQTGTALTGTWRCMGITATSNFGQRKTLFLRIA